MEVEGIHQNSIYSRFGHNITRDMNRKTPELDEFIHNQSQKDSNQSPYAVDDLSEGCSAVDLSSSAEQQEQEQPALQGYELGKGHISEHNHIPISAQYKSSVIQKKESSQKYFMNQEDTFNPNKNGYGQPGVSSTLYNSNSLTWNKNKFKDMLQKQQDKIREISRSRQYSTRKPPKAKTNNSKIFNYSTVKSPITNNTVEKPKMLISMKNSRNHSTDESSLSMNYSRGRMSNTHIQKESSQSSVISCLTEQKNNTTIISSNTSTVQNYLDYRHMQTKDRIDKIKADRMKEQLSKCRSKPVINKRSIKIAKKLNKNTFERLYNAGKQKKQQQVAFNGTQVQIPYHRSHFGAQPTFSPSINKKSRSLSRTVKDLYIWNHQKNGHLKQKREQGSTHKIKICPGSAAIEGIKY